jgi:hypothetical protein
MKQLIVSKLYEKTGYDADLYLVSALINIAAALKVSSQVHEIESVELLQCCDEFEEAAHESMFSTTMDYPENVTKVLRPKKQGPETCSEEVSQAGAFFEGPLNNCMRYDLTKLLSTAQVVTFVHGRFYGCLHLFRELPIRNMSDLFQIRSGITSYRYAPYTMFFFEAIMKAFYALLVAAYVLSVQKTGDTCIDSYTRYLGFHCDRIGIWEHMIYFFTITSFIYEIGEILHKSRGADDMKDMMASVRLRVGCAVSHVLDRWNMLDVLTLIFIAVWAFSKDDRPVGAHAFMSLAAVTLTLSSLRFYTLSQHAGQLMLMVFEILKDLQSFVFVLFACFLGFGIVYRCLFPLTDAFQSAQATFLTLVDSALSDAEFEVFAGSVHETNGVGLMIIYKILVSIVILNLIVARMSATHDNINENSLEVWAKLQAVNTQQFILLRERNIFCVLPAPLNVLSIVAGGIQQMQRFYHRSQDKKKPHMTSIKGGMRPTSSRRAVGGNGSMLSQQMSPRSTANLPKVNERQALGDISHGGLEGTDTTRCCPSIVSAVADRVVSLIMAPSGALYEVYLANKAVIQAPVPRWVPMVVIAFTVLQLPVIIGMYFGIILWCVASEPTPFIAETTREIQFMNNSQARKCFSLSERRLAVLFLISAAVNQFLLTPSALKPFGAALTLLTVQLLDAHIVKTCLLRTAFNLKIVRKYNNMQVILRRLIKNSMKEELKEAEYLHWLTVCVHTLLVFTITTFFVPRQFLNGSIMLLSSCYLAVFAPVTDNTHAASTFEQCVVPIRKMNLTGYLAPKYENKDIGEHGVMNVNIMRADLVRHGKTQFQRRANPYVVASYRTEHGDMIQYTDTKKRGGSNVMWSHQTCRFSLEPNCHVIQFAVYDRIDVDSDDATCDELLCWTDAVEIKEWIANNRFEGNLPLYDRTDRPEDKIGDKTQSKCGDRIQLDVKILYRRGPSNAPRTPRGLGGHKGYFTEFKDDAAAEAAGNAGVIKKEMGAKEKNSSETATASTLPRSTLNLLPAHAQKKDREEKDAKEPLYTEFDRRRILKRISNTVVATTAEYVVMHKKKEKVFAVWFAYCLSNLQLLPYVFSE